MNEQIESQISKKYKSILAGEMLYVKTHLDLLENGHISFLLQEGNFAIKEEDGPLPVKLECVNQVYLFIASTRGSFAVPLSYVLKTDNGERFLQCDCALPPLCNHTDFVARLSWAVYVVLQVGNEMNLYRLKEMGENRSPIKRGKNLYYNRQNQYHPPYEEFKFHNIDMVTMLYITIKGNYSILVIEKEKRYLTQFVLTCRQMKLSQKGLSIIVRSKYPDKNWKGFCLHYRSEQKENKEEYWFPLDSIKDKGEGVQQIHAFMNLKDCDFKPLTWYITAVFEEDGYRYRVNVKIGIHAFNKMFCGFFGKNCYEDKNHNIMFPFRTQSGSIALKVRQRTNKDSFRVRLTERLAVRLYPFCRKAMERKNIYLVYEKYCEMAQDNGYYFFKYCMDHNVEQELGSKIYYVIDRKASDYEKLSPYRKNVVPFLSFQYFIYMMAAKLLISSDNKLHAFTWNPMPSLIPEVIARKNHVFLQHGVTALKIVKNVFDRNGKFATDLFIVTSKQEKQIISRYYHYKEEEIAITGFARWDVLRDCSGERKEILVMPTWRNGLDSVSDEEFCNSEYYTAYRELLNSEKLQKILVEKDAYLCFYIHPKMRQYFSNFSSHLERVALVSFSELPLNELIMRCKLLITDYSSVSWDVFYQGKPVLFYQFDVQTYNETNGSFIDMEKDLFGDRAKDLESLLELLEENIDNNFVLKEKYKKMQRESFAFMDNENSKRICEAIKSKEWVEKTERRFI